MSEDTVYRREAVNAFPEDTLAWDISDGYLAPHYVRKILEELPSAQSEPSIPLSWFDEQIERLKSLDNAFATLTAMQISGMVKKWRDEQDE